MRRTRGPLAAAFLCIAIAAMSLVAVPGARALADSWSGGFLRDAAGALDEVCSAGCGATIIGLTWQQGFLRDSAGNLAVNCSNCASGSGANTPNPSPSGFFGPYVVAQATALPTFQPGYIGANGERLSGLAAGSNICTDANKNFTTNGCAGGGSVVGVTAGSDIVVTTPNPNSPTVSVTARPSFYNAAFIDTGTGSASSVYRAEFNGANGYSNVQFNNYSTPAPAAGGGSNINFTNSQVGGGSPYVEIETGLGGSSGVATYGGYLVIQTKGDGTGTFTENMVFDHNGHLAALQTAMATTTTSPASCAALAACGTVSYTFSIPFTNPAGSAENPRCTGLVIQDTTTPGDIWIGNVNTVSSTAVTFQYAPTTATTGAKSLTVTFDCWDSNY